MSDHLPECPLLEPCDDEVPEHGYCSMQKGVFCIHCHQWCICDMLRACEQRMLDDDVLAAAHHGQKGYEIGFRKGLDAAREAVETVWTDDPSWDGTNWNNALYEALAAIDALKEKQ